MMFLNVHKFGAFGLMLAGQFICDKIHADVKDSKQSDPKYTNTNHPYRLSFFLNKEIKYATHYNKETRELSVKISNSKASDFDNLSRFDTRYIHRITLVEENKTVTLKIQLKNEEIMWSVHNDDHSEVTGLMLDFWKPGVISKSLEQTWNWNASDPQIAQETGTTSPSLDNPKRQKGSPTISQVDTHKEVKREQKEDLEQKLSADPPVASSHKLSHQKETPSQTRAFPLGFGRMHYLYPGLPKMPPQTLEALAQFGASVGAVGETTDRLKAVQHLFHSEKYKHIIGLTNEAIVKEKVSPQKDDKLFLYAGETAYLIGEFATAKDFFYLVRENSSNTKLKSHAIMRLADIDVIQKYDKPISSDLIVESDSFAEKEFDTYLDLSNQQQATDEVQVSSLLKIADKMDASEFASQKSHAIKLNKCAQNSFFALELRKFCAYIQIRKQIDLGELSLAVENLDKRKNEFGEWLKFNSLSVLLSKSVKQSLVAHVEKKEAHKWIELEKSLPPDYIQKNVSEASEKILRAKAWEDYGEPRKAIVLYQSVYKDISNPNDKIDILMKLAEDSFDKKNIKEAKKYIKELALFDYRKLKGIGKNHYQSLYDMLENSQLSREVFDLFLDELALSLYEESNLSNLIKISDMAVKFRKGESLLTERVKTYVAQTEEQSQQQESALLKFADAKRVQSNFGESAQLYLSVAKLPKAKKKSEAAYKAGLLFVQAGDLTLAKQSFELAALSATDARYLELAKERLDKLK